MRQVIVVSNRLPLVIEKEDSRFTIREGAGGLVTAIKPLLTERGGAWVGFSGMFASDRGTGWEEKLEQYGGEAIDYHAITPEKSVYDGYYLQYANQELWPRFHEMTEQMQGSAARYWSNYTAMNELFARHTLQVASEDSLLWVQDYHLMLLPRLLREKGLRSSIGHFLHIPFPSAGQMATQPHATQILDGVLGSDLLGFHIPRYMHNFIASAEQIVGATVRSRSETEAVLDYQGRDVRLGAFPIGIRPATLRDTVDTDAVGRRLEGRAGRLILSMDRLDYTKAIPPRLEAYGMLLDQHDAYREQVSLVQLIDLSRKSIPAYQQEREKVDAIVADITSRHNSWKSLYFVAERWPRKEVAGVMHLSQIGLITPRCDGMNLVAKEYVAAAPADGVLVLSRQAGAAWQFGEHAVLVDGNDPASVMEGLHAALEMPADDRRSRMAALKKNVEEEDVFWWAERFLNRLQAEAARGERKAALPSAMFLNAELKEKLQDHRLLLLLDYDGTLTPIVRRAEDATLSEETRDVMRKLAQRATVAVVSGRDRADVTKMVGLDELVYAGSHGFDIRGPGIEMEHAEAQHALPDLDAAEEQLQQDLAAIRGARVERKRFAIAVHYREVADEQFKQVEQVVDQARRRYDSLRKLGGKKIFELQPDVPRHKGEAVLWLIKALDLDRDDVLPIYIGDDETDENAFRALQGSQNGVGIRVAASDERTAATYVLKDTGEVRDFLTWLLEVT